MEGRRRSSDEMVAFATSHGCDMTKRRFTDWVARGLIANADTAGLGPGKGVRRTWDEHQAQLLLALCKQRENTKSLAVLANLPVGLWLYWPSEPYVRLPQAMKAMQTWAHANSSRSARRSRPPARALAEQLAGPEVDPRIRNRFVELVAELGPYPESFDEREFEARIADLLGEAPEESPFSVQGLTGLAKARIHAVANIDSFTAAQYDTARAALHTTLRGYESVARPDDPDLLAHRRIPNACLDLATHLGMTSIGLHKSGN